MTLYGAPLHLHYHFLNFFTIYHLSASNMYQYSIMSTNISRFFLLPVELDIDRKPTYNCWYYVLFVDKWCKETTEKKRFKNLMGGGGAMWVPYRVLSSHTCGLKRTKILSSTCSKHFFTSGWHCVRLMGQNMCNVVHVHCTECMCIKNADHTSSTCNTMYTTVNINFNFSTLHSWDLVSGVFNSKCVCGLLLLSRQTCTCTFCTHPLYMLYQDMHVHVSNDAKHTLSLMIFHLHYTCMYRKQIESMEMK